jgi:PIN domain nuclease of toxin-antitoxin system
MRFLLDTHLLVWSGAFPQRLSLAAQTQIENPENELIFSTASIWEAAIKFNLGRKDFQKNPGILRRELLLTGFEELAVLGEHAEAVSGLPPIHKDPFDRILIAQAMVEGITLLTSDKVVAQYAGPILLV